ncbi:hypothetical protein IF651_03200 [Cellulosimicrobium arenosum]|uniref:Glycosyl transferase n=1 Tax=Cellulosimicrobium arenosum TaxID=2708133 RepID=A0A927G7N7_9MICO|nr:hypothetical protein [Cellulosimicrobium arenosum]
MRSVPHGREPGDREIADLAGLVERPLLVVGNGPSAAMPRYDVLPADAVVFRMNWFFLESQYHLGRHVDAWFSAVPHADMERRLAEEIRTGRYEVDRLANPVRVSSARVGERNGNPFLGLGLTELDSWAVVAQHPRLARHFMSRPGLPTTGLQALAFGLAVGFRDIHLAGIDLYESKDARYGFTVPEEVQATLREKDLRPGYEDAHSVSTDLAFLRACLTEFPDARITTHCASETLELYLPGPAPLAEGRAMSPETVPLLGRAKDRVVPAGTDADGTVRLEVREVPTADPWAEVEGRRCAYVTVVSGDYHHGARALANSLRTVSDVPLVALCTPDANTTALLASGIHVVDVPPIVNPHTARGTARAGSAAAKVQDRFAATYTKLHVFRLDAWDRLVYLDADTVVLGPVDELFAGDDFAAVPDAGLDLPRGDVFNSGVFAFTPSREVFARMEAVLRTGGSYDGGDQGFLNAFLPSWRALPLEFNTTKRIFAHHAPLFDAEDVRVLHHVGAKPWQPGARGGAYDELDAAWLEHLRPWELRELVQDLRDAAAAGAGGLRAPGADGLGTPHRRAKELASDGRWDEVERVLTTAWATRGATVGEHRQLARAYRHLGRYDESLDQLRRARVLDPRSPQIAKEERNAVLRARYARSGVLPRVMRTLPVGRSIDEAIR